MSSKREQEKVVRSAVQDMQDNGAQSLREGFEMMFPHYNPVVAARKTQSWIESLTAHEISVMKEIGKWDYEKDRPSGIYD